MKNKINKNKGFTLIELLVVVAIISILSSIGLASMQDARERAEDTKIIQQVSQFQNAVALFRSTEGSYPYPGTTGKVCLAPDGDACYFGSSTYFSIKDNNFIANASSILDYIKFDSFALPVVNVRTYGINYQRYGGGIIYQCINYSGGECKYAEVFFATNKPVQKGTLNKSRYSGGGWDTVYKQDSADPGAGNGGSY